MKEIESQLQDYLKNLAEYEPVALSENLFTLLRSLEELNSLPGEWDNMFEFTMLQFNPTNEQDRIALEEAYAIMNKRFIPGIGDRFNTLVNMCAAFPELDSAGNAATYFQDRRQWLVATLLLVPHICKGEKKIPFTEILNELLPFLEKHLAGLSYFNLIKKGANAGTNNYDNLEYLFTNPVFISSFDLAWFGEERSPDLEFEEIPAGQLHSYVQIENFLLPFSLTSEIYAELRYLIKELKNYCKDDYTVIIPAAAFEVITKDLIHLKSFLFSPHSDYYNAVHSIAPFVRMNGNVRTSVTLLSAFVNQVQPKAASRSKAFQIDSSIVFEKKVTEILEDHGFPVRDVKRLNNKEFTLTTAKGYNFICKSNIVDFVRVNNDYKAIARLNRLRIMQYEKEVADKTFIVSRLPVLSPVPGIINFSSLGEFLATLS